MSAFVVQQAAGRRIDDIYVYTRETWGQAQAQTYILGLFERFEQIANKSFPWRAIPAEFGVSGYFCRYKSHVIYWKTLGEDKVGIVTILHERMHQIERLKEDLL